MCAAAIAWDETLRMDASCSACGDAERRLAWGCDREAAKPTISLPCWHCDAEKPSATCEGCGGRGVIAWHRCPNRSAAEAADVISFVHLVEAGISPWGVPWCDLPREVLMPFQLASARRGLYARRDRKRREGKSTLAPMADRPDASDAFRHRWPGGTKQ